MVLRWSRMQKLRVSQRRRGWHETVSCSGSAFSRVSFGEQVVEKIAQTRHPRAARTVVLRNGSSVLLPAWRRASLSCVHAQRCGARRLWIRSRSEVCQYPARPGTLNTSVLSIGDPYSCCGSHYE